MAKFCGNCGTRLEDNARICGNCGTPLEGLSVGIPNLKTNNPGKRKNRKKIVKRAAVLAILAVIIVIAFNLVPQRIGYNGLLRKIMAAYQEYDMDTLISLSSDIHYYGMDYYGEEDWIEYYFDSVGNDLDSFENSVGYRYKFTYEVNEIYTLSERRLDELLKEIERVYPDFDESIIEKAAVADVTITAKQGNKSVEQNRKIVMSQEDKEWKLLYIE